MPRAAPGCLCPAGGFLVPAPALPAPPESRHLWGCRCSHSPAVPSLPGQPSLPACSVRLCHFPPLAARNVLWDLCFFQPLTRADGLACCVRCCFKRAERNKIIRLGVSAGFSDMFLRSCRRGRPPGPQPCAGVGSSKQSLPVLMRCGQLRWAQRCGEMSCGRREPTKRRPCFSLLVS